MSLSAEFDTAADRRAYALVAAGAAVLSYDHARAFFLPFMGPAGASVTPLLLDAVVFWLASANVRQARAGVLRELDAGRLAPAAAVAASGLMDRPEVPELHRAALAAALGGTTALPAAPDAVRTEIDSVRDGLLAEITAVREAL